MLRALLHKPVTTLSFRLVWLPTPHLEYQPETILGGETSMMQVEYGGDRSNNSERGWRALVTALAPESRVRTVQNMVRVQRNNNPCDLLHSLSF